MFEAKTIWTCVQSNQSDMLGDIGDYIYMYILGSVAFILADMRVANANEPFLLGITLAC